MLIDPNYPTSLERKPGPARHLTDESADILKSFYEAGRRPGEAAKQFAIHEKAARHRFHSWRFH